MAATAQRSQLEHHPKGRVNTAHLVEAQEPDARAEPAWVRRLQA